MLLLLGACTLAVAALSFAFFALRALRLLAGEVQRLQHLVGELVERIVAIEQRLSVAASRAEAAGTVLLEKGLADEEELEAARRRYGGPAKDAARRGPRTVH